jgi:phospholipid/cholesterol/gamma-HCH transport system ATP-binding protein
VIHVRHLSKSFGDRAVLVDVNLDVADGTNTVVIGRSGTGKSVLLKHLVGLLTPDAGSVTVDDALVTVADRGGLAAIRSRVGFVFQFAALFDSMTVGENVALGLVKQGLPATEIPGRVAESLALVNLDGSEAKFPAELSGGMRKRVGIARAIALRPKYILYDEPTSGLDPVTSAVIDRLMVRTRELGVTGVIVTHDMRSAYTVGDRIAMLHEGRIQFEGTPEEVRSTTDHVVHQFVNGIPDDAEAA